jgi:DNA-binding NarL/FixJ family response regulator
MDQISTATVKLLVITDTPEAVSDTRRMLIPAPEVEIIGEAMSAAEAIALSSAHQPDIVIMDYDMPGHDAADTTRSILQTSPTTQVIMLSLVNEADDIRHAMRAGARDYLVKPLEPNELVDTIRWLLRERREYARMQAFVNQLRKAYEALFTDDKPVPANVVTFLEAQVEKSPDRLTLETLAVAYARNRHWDKLIPLVQHLAQTQV